MNYLEFMVHQLFGIQCPTIYWEFGLFNSLAQAGGGGALLYDISLPKTYRPKLLLYPSLTELPSIEIKWALQDVSELGYLFLNKSSLHIIAWDLDVERSQLLFLILKLEWCQIL